MAKKKVQADQSAANGTAHITKIEKTKRPTAARKKPATKKVSATKSSTASKPVPTIEPTDEQIRIRAYFISRQRHEFALPGDANADWIEARRQLLLEIRPR